MSVDVACRAFGNLTGAADLVRSDRQEQPASHREALLHAGLSGEAFGERHTGPAFIAFERDEVASSLHPVVVGKALVDGPLQPQRSEERDRLRSHPDAADHRGVAADRTRLVEVDRVAEARRGVAQRTGHPGKQRIADPRQERKEKTADQQRAADIEGSRHAGRGFMSGNRGGPGRLVVAEVHQLTEQEEPEEDHDREDGDVRGRGHACGEDERRGEEPLRGVARPHRFDRLVGGDEEDQVRRGGDGTAGDERGIDDVEWNIGDGQAAHDHRRNHLRPFPARHAKGDGQQHSVKSQQRRRGGEHGEEEELELMSSGVGDRFHLSHLRLPIPDFRLLPRQ